LALQLCDDAFMPKRSSKIAKRDDFQNALRTVEQAIESSLTKNPAAAALGRLGGLKGGKARAAKLTQEERTSIARNAATARWSKKK
jgi:hypothetical protein